MDNNCLVIKAREECECEDCKDYRKFRDIMIKQQVELEIMKNYHKALKEVGVVP